MDFQTLVNSKIGIYGLGMSGRSSFNFLKKFSTDIILGDDNDQPNEVTPLSSPLWKERDILILAPGITLYGDNKHEIVKIAEANNISIISDLDVLYLYKPNAKYIGITGTNGKSTVVTFIDHVLNKNKKNFCLVGNIGIPALDKADEECAGYVIEISSFQLDLVKYLKFDTSAVINIEPDHIDRHGNFQCYKEAKLKLIESTKDKKNAFIGIDSGGSQELPTNFENLQTCSQKEKSANFYLNAGIIYHNGKELVTLPENNIIPENLLISFALLYNYGLSLEEITSNITNFQGLAHRSQLVYKDKDFIIINDSKATNLHAAMSSIRNYQNIIWLAGGIFKEEDFGMFDLDFLKNIKLAYFFGRDADKFCQYFTNILPYEKVETVFDAVKNIADKIDILKPATILLSPACASLDQFASFADRGLKFTKYAEEEIVSKLKEKE